MKRILFGLAICILSQIALAQTATDYKFSATVQAPYVPLPETAVTLPGSTTVKDETFKTTFFNQDGQVNYSSANNVNNYDVVPLGGIPIGFDFTFADMVCDKFVAAGTGFIFLAPKTDDKVQIQGLASGSMVTKWFPTIGIGVGSTGGEAYGIDGTSIRYLLQGEAGDRTLTVEYTAVSYMDKTHPFNFQIKLYERNSEIELIFDAFKIPNTGAWSVGFTGKETDHYHLKPTNKQWENATRINTPTAYAYISEVDGSTFPEGLHYRFTPPALVPPADLTITGISDTELTFDVTPNTQNNDILVVLTDQVKTNTSPWIPIIGQPENGKTYQAGDRLYATDQNGKLQIGGRVIYAGPAGEHLVCQPDDLKANTLYFCAAFSYNAERNYSDSYTVDDTVSPARLPFYESFNTMNYDNLPLRWPGTKGFAPAKFNGEDVVQSRNDGSVLVFPAMEYPGNLDLRLTLDYHIYWQDLNWSPKPLAISDWGEGDSIVIEYSTDEGKTFHYSHSITKQNALSFTGIPDNQSVVFAQQILRLPNFGGGKAILRLRHVLDNTAERNRIDLNINDIHLEAIDLCDYPALLTPVESSIINDKAAVRWVPGDNNETVWNLKTEMMDADGQWQAWEAPREVSGSSYAFENLASNRKYRVSLQAVCGTGNLSRWISTEFQSGWTPAFVEGFNKLEPIYFDNLFLNYKMPAYWAMTYEYGVRKPDSVSAPMASATSPLAVWKTQEFSPALTPEDKSIWMDLSSFMGSTALRLPTVDIQNGQKPRLVFDYAYGRFSDSEFLPVSPTENGHDLMLLWVSDDIETEKFALKDTVRCWNFATLATAYDQGKVSFDLSGYNGNVAVIIGFYSLTSFQTLYLDNIGIVYDCPMARHLALQAGSLTETAAALTWQADPTHDSWTVIRRNGATETSETVTGTGIRWDNLLPETEYTVLVGQPCADTSAWSHIRFKTGGGACEAVSNIAVSAISQRSATLSWNGTAAKYRIRIRPVAATPETAVAWTVYESESTTYTFSNLTPNTMYEGAIQSVCGEAVGDTADYVAFEQFQTKEPSCFAPTEIKATQVDYASATITWQSEAANYQLEYRREGSLDIMARHHCTTNEYKLENLDGDTRYEVRLRSICSAGDTSAWSAFAGFATTTPPACTEPTDLKTEAITLNSARLSWTAAENSTGFIVRYSKSAPIVWDSVRDIADAQYELTDLEPETIYLWTVMSACRGNRYSNWAARQNFKTSPTANEDLNDKRFEIYADKGQIHILNRAAVPMERIRIYDFQGRLLHDFIVRTNDNAILTTNRRNCMTVVEIESEGQFLRYKVRLP